MVPELDDPKQWRFRAKEMRTVAEDMKDENCRLTALRLAADYERMAKHAERHGQDAQK
jgi:hypothetical protein